MPKGGNTEVMNKTHFGSEGDLGLDSGFDHLLGFLSSSNGKDSAGNVGDLGLIPGSERSLEKVMATHSNILAWRISWTEEPGRLQSMRSQRIGPNWATFTFDHLLAILEEEMATYSSLLAWKIPWTEESGGLQSRGQRSLEGYSPWGPKSWTWLRD